MSHAEILAAELARLALDVSEESRGRLVVYAAELERWNRKMNLTGLRGEALMRSLIVEPVWIGYQLQLSGVLVDVGSGNGSPGIPLCITQNIRQGHLIEARTRRAVFLRHIVGKLHLKNVVVHQDRLEMGGSVAGLTDSGIPPDWVTLRGVAPTPAILEAVGTIAGPTTKIVWITSNAVPPILPARQLCVPESGTEAWIFAVDQSWPI